MHILYVLRIVKQCKPNLTLSANPRRDNFASTAGGQPPRTGLAVNPPSVALFAVHHTSPRKWRLRG